MSPVHRSERLGFSLIELVIVIVIMGVIAAIAIPRVLRGSEGSNAVALRSDLATVRKVLEAYALEHGGALPLSPAQLTQYTDAAGDVSSTATATHVYGPYLFKFPELPVGINMGSAMVRASGQPGDGEEGWFFDVDLMTIRANTKDQEVDAAGVPYNTY